jgi:hypothetical protein
MGQSEIKLKGLTAEQTASLLPHGLILLGWRGSVAHGMYVPSNDPDSIDDKDVMGVYVNPVEHYLGFGRKEVREKWEGPYDCVFYEVRKMVSLLLNCNPNVLSLLWLKDNSVIYKTLLGQRLQDQREIFVTKKAYHSFNGYAYGQFKRMTHMNQDTLSDITNRRVELLSQGCTDADGELTLPAGASAELINKRDQYNEIRGRYYKGYMGTKRRELVERHGYDTKNAAHLIRILRMGIEFLIDGTLYVEREDKNELMDIKQGLWPLDKVKAEAERLFALAQESYVRSPLPPEPDRARAEQLVIDIVSDYHKLRARHITAA